MAELKIKADSGGGTVSFKGPATTTSNAAVQLTLPVDDGTSGQYLKTDGSGALSWAAAGVDGIVSSADATAMTIDSSENVGIGTGSPARTLHVSSGSTNETARFESTDTEVTVEFKDTTGTASLKSRNDFRFYNSTGELGRIDANGKLCMGATAPLESGTALINAEGANMVAFLRTSGNSGSNDETLTLQNNYAAGGTNATCIRFNSNAGSGVGFCRVSANNSVAYLTSSDYRLKENNVAIADGITKVKALKPYRFNWKSEPSLTVDGFFAHEVSPSCPEAVHGTKDEVKDGNPVYQNIDHSKLVPLLTAALKEAIGKIEVLETKVAALEAG